MAKIEFDIDSYITSYGYDNRYVKGFLKQSGGDPVVCHLCSPGGDFLMASNIKDEFSKHGNVTVDISGYAASAATYIALGAKHTRMSNSSFYLIHKVMTWVDAWGAMNEDEIAALLVDLEKIKDENTKMTLVLAKAYVEKSGKTVPEILNLMKEEKWLNADEAKEWGFVDEVYNTTTSKQSIDKIASKVNMLGLPGLPIGHSTFKNQEVETIVAKVITGIKNLMPKSVQEIPVHSREDESSITNKTTQMKNFVIINAILNIAALESSDGKGVYLNEAQLQALENAISEKDTSISSLSQHETTYNSALTTLNTLHPDVAAADTFENKIEKVREKLAAKAGVPASGTKENQHPENDGVDWEKMNSLDHMKD